MRVAIRVDASGTMGSGHLMRCLTLASQLKPHCAEIVFVSRPLPEHLGQLLDSAGLTHQTLSPPGPAAADGDLRHADWLGASQQQDAAETLAALAATGKTPFDWLIVDHYGIDYRWESALRQSAKKIMVIDDLADRKHDCDALVDQNRYQDQESRYTDLVPHDCRQFIGPGYAFLRDEFHAARTTLEARSGKVNNLFIYFGGADPDNHTMGAIQALLSSGAKFPSVDVVIGLKHPDRKAIEAVCSEHGFNCHVQTEHIAQLMARADLAVGAGGISTFERLYLRLPSIVRPISFNQIEQLEFIASLELVKLYRNEGELAGLLRSASEAGVETPADCVGSDNPKIVSYMLGDDMPQSA